MFRFAKTMPSTSLARQAFQVEQTRINAFDAHSCASEKSRVKTLLRIVVEFLFSFDTSTWFTLQLVHTRHDGARIVITLRRHISDPRIIQFTVVTRSSVGSAAEAESRHNHEDHHTKVDNVWFTTAANVGEQRLAWRTCARMFEETLDAAPEVTRLAALSQLTQAFATDSLTSSGCKEESGLGVVCVRTPVGLSVDKWEQGLAEYARTHAAAETA